MRICHSTSARTRSAVRAGIRCIRTLQFILEKVLKVRTWRFGNAAVPLINPPAYPASYVVAGGGENCAGASIDVYEASDSLGMYLDQATCVPRTKHEIFGSGEQVQKALFDIYIYIAMTARQSASPLFNGTV